MNGYTELQVRIFVSLLTDMVIDGNGRSISYENGAIIITNNSTGWIFKIMTGYNDTTSNVIIIRDNHYIATVSEHSDYDACSCACKTMIKIQETILNFNGTYDGFDLEKAMRGE